jgi:hypothetical protein
LTMTASVSAIRHHYFEWLTLQVGDESVTNIHPLCTIMHQKEFVWFVANDDNRLQDGLDLRLEFLYEFYDPTMMHALRLAHVSFLEVLIGLSHRLDFQRSGGADIWAWVLLEHLGLDKYRGRMTTQKREEIEEILDRVIWRTYEPDGSGGFFPLAWPEQDQRKVEIWYQMMAWIGEQHPM